MAKNEEAACGGRLESDGVYERERDRRKPRLELEHASWSVRIRKERREVTHVRRRIRCAARRTWRRLNARLLPFTDVDKADTKAVATYNTMWKARKRIMRRLGIRPQNRWDFTWILSWIGWNLHRTLFGTWAQ